jgi:hypothetical protein
MRTVVALVLAATVAGCGGGEAPRALDHVGYEVRLAPLDDALDEALYGDAGTAAERLTKLSRTLDRVMPPPNATSDNAELARVLDYLAEDVRAGDMLAFAADWELLQDVVYSLVDVGYQPFDGPDDE